MAVAIEISPSSHALPAGNGWRIEERDFFENSASIAPAPNIVVANPPWEYSNEDRQDDQAQRILAHLIEIVPEGGLLGVILPAGWLTRRSPSACRSRSMVFEKLAVLETWRLPEGTFPKARLGAAVVLAKREPLRNSRPMLYRRVSQKSKLEAFFERGASECTISWSGDPDLACEDQSMPGGSSRITPGSPLVVMRPLSWGLNPNLRPSCGPGQR